jgi:PAS domain S-box-containing protein
MADILMPMMDGYELVRQLRSEPATAQISVMFCTATYGDEDVRRLATAVGVSHIMVKPYEPEEIIRITAEALEADDELPPPLPPEEFHREHLRVLNAKLVQKVEQLEESKQQAAESLTLLETLLSTAPVGFGFVDRDFAMVRMNDMLAAVNGLPLEQQLGRTVAAVVPGLWPQLEPLYRHVLQTGEAILNQETSGSPPSAPEEVRHWLASYYPVRLNEEVIGIGLIVLDVTEQRKAEDFRAVVMDNMAEGLYVMDGEGRFTFLNAAASKMLGWTSDELRGMPAHATIHFQRLDGSLFSGGTVRVPAGSRPG